MVTERVRKVLKQKIKKGQVVKINADLILPSPYQPRRDFDEEALGELAQSIRENGVLQPITVRPHGDMFELVAGERRLRACKIARLTQIPCIVTDLCDEDCAVFTVLENLQREDLNFFEEAQGYKSLIDNLSLTQEAVATRLGKSQSCVANKIRLLKLIDRQRDLIIKAGLTERHARALLKLDSDTMRDRALSYIIAKRLGVTQAEEYIDNLSFDSKYNTKKGQRIVVVKDVRIFLNTLNKAIDLMKKSGIKAQSTKVESEDFVEYTVKIPKNVMRRKA